MNATIKHMQDNNNPNQNQQPSVSPGAVLQPSSTPPSPATPPTPPSPTPSVTASAEPVPVASDFSHQPVQPQQEDFGAPVVSQQPLGSLQEAGAAQSPQPGVQRDNMPGLDSSAPHIEWTASEYLEEDRSVGWFALLGVATVTIAVVVYFLTGGEVMSTLAIVIVGVVFGVFSARKPQVLHYAISNTGIHIGSKLYGYESFKWFSIVSEGALGYIYLMPLKRFMPPLVIHYDPSDEDAIGRTLMEYLPYEDYRPSFIEDISRKFRI